MSKKIAGIVLGLILTMGITAGGALANHKHDDCVKHGHYSCSKKMGCGLKNCMLRKRKECVCYYIKYSEELGLSEEQVAELKKLNKEAQTLKIRNLAEVDVIKLEVNSLLDEKKPDLAAIETKMDEISKLISEVKKACIGASLKAREVLTEEQYKLSKKLGKTKKCKMAK